MRLSIVKIIIKRRNILSESQAKIEDNLHYSSYRIIAISKLSVRNRRKRPTIIFYLSFLLLGDSAQNIVNINELNNACTNYYSPYKQKSKLYSLRSRLYIKEIDFKYKQFRRLEKER